VKKAFLIVAALVSFTAFAFAGDVLAITEIAIDVAPNVLNLQRTDDKCVTVHTDIPFDEVDSESVRLVVGGVEIIPYSTYYDLRGDLVAKVWMKDLRNLVVIGVYNTFTLTGFELLDYGEDAFSGTQEILVVDNVPKGR
jgi:hypothetical protein